MFLKRRKPCGSCPWNGPWQIPLLAGSLNGWRSVWHCWANQAETQFIDMSVAEDAHGGELFALRFSSCLDRGLFIWAQTWGSEPQGWRVQRRHKQKKKEKRKFFLSMDSSGLYWLPSAFVLPFLLCLPAGCLEASSWAFLGYIFVSYIFCLTKTKAGNSN